MSKKPYTQEDYNKVKSFVDEYVSHYGMKCSSTQLTRLFENNTARFISQTKNCKDFVDFLLMTGF